MFVCDVLFLLFVVVFFSVWFARFTIALQSDWCAARCGQTKRSPIFIVWNANINKSHTIKDEWKQQQQQRWVKERDFEKDQIWREEKKPIRIPNINSLLNTKECVYLVVIIRLCGSFCINQIMPTRRFHDHHGISEQKLLKYDGVCVCVCFCSIELV